VKFHSNNHISTAGQYLRSYENERYSFFERNFQFLNNIVVPTDAEDFADISFYQAGMNWDTYAQHARAVILRIGQNNWLDVEFERNYTEAKKRGLAVGGYFFFDGRATPQQQANVIFNAMKNKSFELELFIDWEKNYGGLNEGLPNVVKLMQLVEAAGVNCNAVGLYTGYYYFVGNSNPTTHATQYAYLKTRPLWLAWYASAALVKVPAPWSDWTHWQYGTPVSDWGQPTAELDRNRHNGTRAEFEARYLGGVVVPPPAGGTMKGTVQVTANIRDVNNVIVGKVYAGDFMYGEVKTAFGLQRLFFEIVDRADGTVEMFATGSNVAVKTTDGVVILKLTNETDPPPATGLPATLYIATKADMSDKVEYRKVS
jgi:lysozyme